MVVDQAHALGVDRGLEPELARRVAQQRDQLRRGGAIDLQVQVGVGHHVDQDQGADVRERALALHSLGQRAAAVEPVARRDRLAQRLLPVGEDQPRRVLERATAELTRQLEQIGRPRSAVVGAHEADSGDALRVVVGDEHDGLRPGSAPDPDQVLHWNRRTVGRLRAEAVALDAPARLTQPLADQLPRRLRPVRARVAGAQRDQVGEIREGALAVEVHGLRGLGGCAGQQRLERHAEPGASPARHLPDPAVHWTGGYRSRGSAAC